jgi:hypothetical protein
MPTNRHRRRQEARPPLLPAVRHLLLTGEYPSEKVEGWVAAFTMFRGDRARATWAEHRDELLEDWIAEHPGRRPAAWWRWEATESRRVLGGTADHIAPDVPDVWEWVWRQDFGVPAFWPQRARVIVEAEATYLKRLGLLVPGEASELGPEDFEPEEVSGPGGAGSDDDDAPLGPEDPDE